jgi:hypothetical protein
MPEPVAVSCLTVEEQHLGCVARFPECS